MRNPLLHFGALRFQFIGDVHAGRKFITNAPLERRGEYEDRQYTELKRLLAVPADYHIQVGDMFDKFHVDESDVMRVYEVLRDCPAKRVYLLSGNHDLAKNTTDVSSFELLAIMVQSLPHVTVVRDVETITVGAEKMTLCGWEFDRTLIEKLPADTDILVCHMDSVSYGDEYNVIPFEELYDRGVRMVINGHEHRPSSKRIAGVEYIGTGSLLPYSHAEDDGDGIYMSFFDVDSLELEMGNLKDCHVRVYTDTPELIPEFNSLSLQVNKAKQVADDEVQPEHVEVEVWSLEHLGQLAGERTGLSSDKVRSVLNEILEADNA